MSRFAPAAEPHLIDEIRALLDGLHTLQRTHQERLDAQRPADDVMDAARLAEWEDVLRDLAVEASDTLDTTITRLGLLAARPARRAFTVALTGPGYDEGERAWLFVVHATDLTDAHRTLLQLPSFRAWLAESATSNGMQSRVDLLATESHPGTRARGTYRDLRDEQARTLAFAKAPLPPVPAPTPAQARPAR
ncbi:hypothetical protein ACFQ7F_29960 [Streptomyces sp. NPDC056486]|uniref:hypothetical protein n=1 Tax=Streptomyces sp. NPDC056486 TaxID=3345835 RepID=UPI003689BA32